METTPSVSETQPTPTLDQSWRSWLWPALSILFGLGLAWLWLSSRGSNDADTVFQRRLQTKLRADIAKLEAQAAAVETIFKQGPRDRFTKLVEAQAYPTVVYRDSVLYAWNQHQYLPSWPDIAGRAPISLYNSKPLRAILHVRSWEYEGHSYMLASYLTLQRRYALSNTAIGSGDYYAGLERATISAVPAAQGNITTNTKQFLFSVQARSGGRFTLAEEQGPWLLLLSAGLLICLTLWLWQASRFLVAQPSQRMWAFGIGATYAIFIRALAWRLGLPNLWLPSAAFNPRYFNLGFWAPSLGDLVANALTLLIVLGLFYRYGQGFKLGPWVLRRSLSLRWPLALLLAFIAIGLCYWYNHIVSALYNQPSYSLDINSGLFLGYLRFVVWGTYFLATACLFMLYHTLFRGIQFLLEEKLQRIIVTWVVVLLAAFAVSMLRTHDWIFAYYWVLMASYLAITTLWRWSRYLWTTRVETILYMLSFAGLAAGWSMIDLQVNARQQTQQKKQRFATQLVKDRDDQAELLFTQLRDKVIADTAITNNWLPNTATPDRAAIERRILSTYWDEWLDRYQVQVSLFDSVGRSIAGNEANMDLQAWQQKAQGQMQPTSDAGLFFQTDLEQDLFKRYLCFIRFQGPKKLVGAILIEANIKRNIGNAVYPKLLQDKALNSIVPGAEFSYAIYNKNKLRFSYGAFAYERKFDTLWLADSSLFSRGLQGKNWLHFAQADDDLDRVVVVSHEPLRAQNLLAQFSFCFMLLAVGGLLSVLISFAVRGRGEHLQLTLATRIQLYLNAAYFLPLVLLGALALSVISQTSVEDLNKAYLRKAEDISDLMVPLLPEEGDKPDPAKALEQQAALNQIAKSSGLDLSVFLPSGQLWLTNQPLIYERGLVASLAHPVAMGALAEYRQRSELVSETVGKLGFKTAYADVRDPETGKLIGLVGVSYFESSDELTHQITQIISVILILFTTLFLLFLAAGFYASNQLVYPLKLITNRLKRLALTRNRPIEWKRRDELGLLITEYNRMLEKLEASREALSRSEKETAWRSMAQQVAHEIKNPLTPMRLTLQQIERALVAGTLPVEKLERALATLITQVDTLADIAASFSTFAQMPNPTMEPVDVCALWRSLFELYQSTEGARITLDAPFEPIYITGDAKLLTRIGTNLLLNAIQAADPDRALNIHMQVQLQGLEVLVTVTDNGVGIDPSLADKVYTPQFSTKSSGSGIGLAVAKRGIEQMGGKLWFESMDQGGTKFYISLPVALG